MRIKGWMGQRHCCWCGVGVKVMYSVVNNNLSFPGVAAVCRGVCYTRAVPVSVSRFLAEEDRRC